jgi:hypothetical protein
MAWAALRPAYVAGLSFVKKTRRRRIVEIKRRVVIGTQAAVEQVLSVCGWVIK